MTRICLLVVLAGTAWAQQRVQPVEDFINQRLAVWKERLDLKDWKTTVAMCRRSEMKSGTLGAIHWDKRTMTAQIQVLAASEYTLPYAEMLKDMEFTVVHELIHLSLTSARQSGASRSGDERAVNRMTRALLALDSTASPPCTN